MSKKKEIVDQGGQGVKPQETLMYFKFPFRGLTLSDKVSQRFPFFIDIELCARSLRGTAENYLLAIS